METRTYQGEKKRKYIRIVQWTLILMAFMYLCGCSSRAKYKLRETAIEQMNMRDYQTAVQTFNEALNSSNGLVGEFEIDVLKYRAEAEYLSGDYAAAAETYDILKQVDEESKPYLARLCSMYILSGQFDKAMNEYPNLYAAFPDDEDTKLVLLALGRSLQETGRETEAIALFEKAVNDGMKSGELYNQLALCEMARENYDEAISFLDEGLMVGDEAREKLLYNMVAALEQKRDFVFAIQVLETYASEFGSNENVAKEHAFLESRLNGSGSMNTAAEETGE